MPTATARKAQISKTDYGQIFKPKHTKERNINTIPNILMRNGYKQIGSGVFSSVYKKPNKNFVIKYNRKVDSCYFRFLKYAMKQKNNPYLPKTKVLTYDESEKYFVVALELLHPFPHNNITKFKKSSSHIIYGLNYFSNTINDMTVTKFFKYHYGIDNISSIYNSVFFANLIEKFKESLFGKTYFEINKLMDNCKDDLHQNNIMIRPGTNKIVIVDPLFDSYESFEISNESKEKFSN